MSIKDLVQDAPRLGQTVRPNRAIFKLTGYEPHENQLDFHRSNARFKVACCGRRFGKSMMAAKELECYLFQEDCIFWIVAPTYVLGEKEFRVIYNDLMIKKGMIKWKGVQTAYNIRMGNMRIKFPWNTEIIVKSAEDPKGIVGEGLHGVVLAEAAKLRETVWEQQIRPALVDFRGFAIMSSTPEGKNWFHREFVNGIKDDEENKNYASWQLPSWKNPYLYPMGRNDPEIKEIEKKTDPVVFEQEYKASFTAFKGQVYTEFREGTHIIQDYQFNPEWKNYQFWDFGYVNALACIDVQVSPDDTVYIWREIYETEERLEDVIDILKEMDHPEGYRVDCGFGDSADPEAIETINQKWSACDADQEAKENWREGVSLVKKFLKVRDKETGKVGLYITADCVHGIDEFINYRTAKPTRATANDPKEVALKKNDHIMDALRYGLMHLYVLGVYNLVDVWAANRPMTKPITVSAKSFVHKEKGIFNYADMADHF